MNTNDNPLGHLEMANETQGAKLLEELRQTLRRFVVLPSYAAETLALWILHTYAFELRKVTTYIGLASPEKRCGKTTLLGVLTDLVNRPISAANISSSALFRVIAEKRPTLLIDEADTFLDGNEELRGILNSGYHRKGAYVMRVASGGISSEDEDGGPTASRPAKDGTRLARFSCWCPKAIAAIGRLPETLADRSIVITLQRKRSNEPCERLRDLDGTEMRRRCAEFVGQHEVEIANARPRIPAALNDRAGDIWEPLLALADLAGGEWPALARVAATHLSGTAQETNSAASLLLGDIQTLFMATHGERLFSRDIVRALNQAPDRRWQELRRGKAPTEMWLAMQLRGYGIRPRTLWIGSEAGKGYEREDFEEVFSRYLPEAGGSDEVTRDKD